jgi:hypothetical protein
MIRCGIWEDIIKLDVKEMGKVQVNIIHVTGVGFLLTALSLGTRFYFSFKRLFLILSCLTLLNPLNAELNPICHLLILLGDLTFMSP